MLVLVGGSTLALLVAPGSTVAVLGSAALFGVGFTTGFALVVMWSQQVFHDRPTTGFRWPSCSSRPGSSSGRACSACCHPRRPPVALLAAATPALLVALVPPSRDDHFKQTLVDATMPRPRKPSDLGWFGSREG